MDISMQRSSSNRILGIFSLQRLTREQHETLLFVVMFCIAFCLVPLLVGGGANLGLSLVLGIITALVLAIVIVRWPLVGLYVVAGCILLIEDNPAPISMFTDT